MTCTRRLLRVFALGSATAIVTLALPSGAAVARTTTAAAVGDADPVPLARPAPGDPRPFIPSAILWDLELGGPEYEAALDRYDTVARPLRETETILAESAATQTSLAAQRTMLRAQFTAARAHQAQAAQREAELERAISELAAQLFMGAGEFDALETATDPVHANDAARLQRLAESAVLTLAAERRTALQALADATARVDRARADLQRVGSELTDSRSAVADATAQGQELTAALPDARTEFDVARARAFVQGTDIGLVALDSYVTAADGHAIDDPGCGLEWWGLAGISRVEGRHGTYGSSQPEPDGSVSPPIIGIPLTGEKDTQLVADTDDGTLDGDPVHDRAIGPMQFIPQTWHRFETDGNADEKADPQNLYDATATAAKYLCFTHRGLSGDGPLRAAYLSYNHSEAYADNVLRQARGYEAALDEMLAEQREASR